MPVETDLKTAYRLLYDDKEPEKALELYDSVLKQSPSNLVAHVYKAACLEKLYYGFKDWHSQETLTNASDLLHKALRIAEGRGDRSKQGLVNFRLFVHHFNRKEYLKAKEYLDHAKVLGYQDNTLPMWEFNLSRKLKKLKNTNEESESNKKTTTRAKPTAAASATEATEATCANAPTTAESTAPASIVTNVTEGKPKFRVDWYQSSKSVTISLFTSTLPVSKESVSVNFAPGNQEMTLTYPIPNSGSEFQYNVKLAYEIDPSDIFVSVFTKKIEVTLRKKSTIQWKYLEDTGVPKDSSASFPKIETQPLSTALKYPSSSKKTIDWSKVDLDDEQESSDNADAFFQQLYANADPDTKRAMMKSFVESNGTALNTNWSEVSKGKVESSPPEGLELKKW